MNELCLKTNIVLLYRAGARTAAARSVRPARRKKMYDGQQREYGRGERYAIVHFHLDRFTTTH